MKLFVFLSALFVLLLSSCGSRDASLPSDPGEAAIHYVRCLADGRYDEYIRGMVSCDSATEAYKKQMLVLYKQMVVAKKKEFGTLKSLRHLRSDISGDSSALVYLQLVYANDSTEDVMLPLVCLDGQWRMR